MRVTDKDGVLAPRAKNQVKFTVAGPAVIAATDNGDATSFESFQASERRAYNGLALVIVRTKRGAAGEIKVRAESPGLEPTEVTIASE